MPKKEKKDKNSEKKSIKKIPEKYIKVPLVPSYILIPLWLISLVLPNLVYSGVKFADTLHILKWTVTGVPIAVAVFVAGIRLWRYGKDRINLKFDLFAIIWALMLVYTAIQPLWVKLFSPTAFAIELVCVIAVWAFYVISVASFPAWGLRFVLFLASINSAINTLFAELQIRRMNNLAFLDGTIFSSLRKYSAIILPTPGNYIGNTAQQNMFGLWTAVCALGAVYLFVFDIWRNDNKEHGKKIWVPAILIGAIVVCLKLVLFNNWNVFAILAAIIFVGLFVFAWKFGNDKRVYFSILNLLLLAVNFWGLLNTTSRSGLLALLTGLFVLLIIAPWKFDKNYFIRFLAAILMMSFVFWASFYSSRSNDLVEKTVDIVQNADTVGGRIGIWTTSYAMFKEHPEGVGLGQYKWHYLEGQRAGFKEYDGPWYTWQYTHWAHNEFLQWFCEGGIPGGIILIVMYFSWFVPAVISLFKKKSPPSINSVWGLALVSLISFCALFTRPFHRIENMVWITLGFALSNREFFTNFKLSFEIIKSKIFCKVVAVACVVASVAGVVYISGGIEGNYVLRQAMSTQDPDIQLNYLNEADKYPIVREETQRNLGYHYLQLGEKTNDDDVTRQGFNILWAHFQREPHSEDISRLLSLSQKFQNEEALREIKSYFKPGTYHLERRAMSATDGRTVNALVLVNGPGQDAE